MGELQSLFSNTQDSFQKHYIRLPSAATITCPVIQRASSLARNRPSWHRRPRRASPLSRPSIDAVCDTAMGKFRRAHHPFNDLRYESSRLGLPNMIRPGFRSLPLVSQACLWTSVLILALTSTSDLPARDILARKSNPRNLDSYRDGQGQLVFEFVDFGVSGKHCMATVKLTLFSLSSCHKETSKRLRWVLISRLRSY